MSTFTITYAGSRDMSTTVKLSPNQCLFEIFENFCKSKNLDPSKYELCHSNKILDLRQSVGLVNLPNNATLTVKPITKARNQAVTVCVQLEGTGERQIGEFVNTQSLWEIIGALFPEKVLDLDSETNVSCLYMRTNVVGVSKLQETKLATLGILSGKVAIKLKINCEHNEASTSSKSLEQNRLTKLTGELNQNMAKKVSSLQSSLTSKLEMLKQKIAEKKKAKNSGSSTESKTNVLQPQSEKPEYEIVNQLIELEVDGRKVVIFSQDDKQRLTSNQEVSDDFFEITKEDLRLMHSDLNKAKTELEDRPLETQKLREQRLNREEKKYEFTIIRLAFPFDNLIVQTVFSPSETIGDLMKLAKEFVNVPEFYLYTAPPKKVLDSKSTFHKEKLVPAAIIQFGGHQTMVMKDEFKQQISSFINVASYTSNLRGSLRAGLEQTSDSKTSLEGCSGSASQEVRNNATKEERLMKLLMKK